MTRTHRKKQLMHALHRFHSCMGRLVRMLIGITAGLLLGSIGMRSQAAPAVPPANPDADLELTLGLSTETAHVGDLVTITLIVYNYGPQSAHDVAVHYPLPEGLAFVEAAFSDATDTYDAASGQWLIGTIDKDLLMPVPLMRLEVTARVTQTGSTEHQAEVVSSSQPDPDSVPGNADPAEDDHASATLTAEVAAALDMRLALDVEDGPARPGEALLYTLNYFNTGRAATGVRLLETLPAHTTFDAASSTAGWTPTGTDQYELALGDLAAGASGTVVFAVTVDAAVPEEINVLTNTATITDDGSQGADVTPEDNTAAANTPLLRESEAADLSLTLTTTAQAAFVGEEVSLTVTLANAGPAEATGVEVGVSLPESLALVSHTGTDAYDTATGRWTVGTLDAEASTALVLQVAIQEAGPLRAEVFVSASAQQDPDSTPGPNVRSEDDDDVLTVEGMLEAPELHSPGTTTTVAAGTVDLAWEPVMGTASYEVEVAVSGSEFSETVFAETVEETTLGVEGLSGGATYAWRVRAVSGDVVGTWSMVWLFTVEDTSVGTEAVEIVEGIYTMTGTYPNPFNPATHFTLAVAQTQQVEVVVYDVRGREVAVVWRGTMAAQARRAFVWQAGQQASGLYFIRVVGEHFAAIRRVTLVK